MGLGTRQWVLLWTFYVIYLLFGAGVFYFIEHGAETIRRAKELDDRMEINELLVAFLSPKDHQTQQNILDRLSSYCNKPVTDHREDEYVKPYQWTFYHSVIFAFIICSTLGYGNITPSENAGRYFLIIYAIVGMPVNIILYTYLGEYFGKSELKFGIYFIFYQIFVLVWFVFGLSYILMLIGFIARGMQSKKIARLEQQLMDNLKMTHSRLWQGISKDVSYLRRTLNEANIMRLRPIYVEEMSNGFKACLARSYSCPNLSVIDMKSPLRRRKRACSESFYDGRKEQHQKKGDAWKAWDARVASRHSETNLLRIDKEKTFQQQSVSRKTGNILEQVVMALNNLNNELNELSSPCNTGNMMSDNSIVNTESESVSQIESRRRLRAKSLYPHQIYGLKDEKPAQLTWSGDDYAIQHYLNAQYKSNDDKPGTINSSVNRRRSIFSVFNSVFKRRNTLFSSIGDIEAVPEQTNNKNEEAHSQNSCHPHLAKMKHRANNRDLFHGRGDIPNQFTENASTDFSQTRNVLEKLKPTFLYVPKSDLISINAPINEHVNNITRSPTRMYTNFATSKIWTSSQKQGWTRGRFSVSRVVEDPNSSLMQLQLNRRFSAFPTASYISKRKMVHTTISNSTAPWKRGQFKSTISPLALCTTSSNEQTTSSLDRN